MKCSVIEVMVDSFFTKKTKSANNFLTHDFNILFPGTKTMSQLRLVVDRLRLCSFASFPPNTITHIWNLHNIFTRHSFTFHSKHTTLRSFHHILDKSIVDAGGNQLFSRSNRISYRSHTHIYKSVLLTHWNYEIQCIQNAQRRWAH